MLHNNKKSKKCSACSKDFILKRTDQIYCSPECRTYTNNSLSRSNKEETKALDKKLHLNRKILKEIFNKIGNNEVSKDFLLGAGFDFVYFTSTLYDELKIKYCFCFDYGLTESGDNKYRIAKNENI